MLIKKIAGGTEGISETVTAILAVAHDPDQTEQLRHVALYICESAGAKTDYDKVKSIHDWVKDHIKYYRDPIYREFVQEPIWLINEGFKKSFKAAGDCFVKGTKVLLKEGHKIVPIESLKEGDYIWGYKKWSKVTKVWGDKGRLKTHLIKLNNGSSMRLTPDHKIWISTCLKHPHGHKGKSKCYCKDDEREISRIKVSQIEPGMVVLQPEKIDFGTNEPDPGLYLSDGWSEDRRFAISGKDGDKLFRIKEVIKDDEEFECFDIETEDHFVWLPEADWTVSQCDDHTAVNMALLSAIGIPTRAVITEDPSNPGPASAPYWAHIYCEAEASKSLAGSKSWVPVDSSMWFLKFGEKVGGKHTMVYPSDIPPDIYFDAAKTGRGIRGGLGFIGRAISLGTKYVDKVMNKRIKSEGFNFSHSVNGLGGARPALGQAFSFASGVISQISAFGQSLINKGLQKTLAKRQQQIAQLQIQAETDLAKKAQELQFQSQQLEAERQALLSSEELAFQKLRDSSKSDRLTAIALVGVPLAAILALGVIRTIRERKGK